MLTYRSTGNPLQCQIYYDLDPAVDPPAPGDFVVSQGKRGPGSAYLVLEVRQVKRRLPHPKVRWMLTCQRANVTDLIHVKRYWPMFWYPRDRSRQPVRMGSNRKCLDNQRSVGLH